MSEERVREYYKGFQIIAAFYQGEYQSQGHHKFAAKLEAKKFDGISDAITKMKKIIDAELDINIVNIQRGVVEQHKQVMLEAGRKYLGVGSIALYNRVSHCYECKRPVDNTYDLECVACGWIICSNCVSCGCGYVHFV